MLPNISLLRNPTGNWASVEFTNYCAAATACSPARGTLLTGLYAPQTCMLMTEVNDDVPDLVSTYTRSGSYPHWVYTPSGFPTFGSYLQNNNYGTYWFGKWHLSDKDAPDGDDIGLGPYGFTDSIIPSPNGYGNEGVNGGVYGSVEYDNDYQIVGYFASQLQNFANGAKPWCAVVSLINPHDIGLYPNYVLNYFNGCSTLTTQPHFPPLGPLAVTSYSPQQLPALPKLFNSSIPGSPTCTNLVSPFLQNVTTGQDAPANTTDTLTLKPELQSVFQQAIDGLFGPMLPTTNGNGGWGNFLNAYYWLTAVADLWIGNVNTPDTGQNQTILGQLAKLASAQTLANTVIVFTADHGEYGGAHGLHDKSAAMYDEAINVPLFVSFPTTQYAGNSYLRSQYCSSVDFFGLIAGLAGLTNWKSDNTQLANRQDMISLLEKSSNHSTRTLTSSNQQLNGQPYILHTSDEPYADEDGNYMYDTSSQFANHVVGIRVGNQSGGSGAGKLAFYNYWPSGQISPTSYPSPPVPGNAANEEFYDYANLGNVSEVGNNYSGSSPSALQTAMETALKTVIASELQASLPTVTVKGVQVNLATVQSSAQTAYWAYLSPPSGLAISPGSPVHSSNYQAFTITGTNIQKSANVTINNGGTVAPATIQVSPTTSVAFSAVVPSSGTYIVTVTNPSGQSATVSFTAS